MTSLNGTMGVSPAGLGMFEATLLFRGPIAGITGLYVASTELTKRRVLVDPCVMSAGAS